MKIHFSPASPYVRKCMVLALEMGIADKIEKLPAAAHPVNRDATIVASNPLGKIPTFFTDDGQVLYDSRVICEYLNEYGKGAFFPASGKARWHALTEQSLGDGILDAALLLRYEAMVRPENLRWADWTKGQLEKVHSGLAYIEAHCAHWGNAFDIGKVTLACTLGYLDFRFAHLQWRNSYPATARWFAGVMERPSMKATVPPPA